MRRCAWQALIHQVPRGVLAWSVRAGTNSLATPDNLACWGVRVDARCRVQDCGLTSDLGHLFNGCKKSLDRFCFLHDSVLVYLVDKKVFSKPKSIEVYAQLFQPLGELFSCYNGKGFSSHRFGFGSSKKLKFGLNTHMT